MKIHSGEKSNKCNQCDFASYETANLMKHLTTHSGEKSCKCNQCDFACSDPSSLSRHLGTHTVEKPNKCNKCDNAFARASDLREHMKIHSGEKTNKCNHCNYAFTKAGNLRTHLKTHRVEKNRTNASNVALQHCKQAIWGVIWEHTVEKMHLLWVYILREKRSFKKRIHWDFISTAKRCSYNSPTQRSHPSQSNPLIALVQENP